MIALTIASPNSSGQGYCPGHETAAYHEIAVRFGYRYSHSTPVTFRNGQRIIWHSYKQGEHCLSFGPDAATSWSTAVSTASGRRVEGFGSGPLVRHLTNKRRRYPVLRAAMKETA